MMVGMQVAAKVGFELGEKGGGRRRRRGRRCYCCCWLRVCFYFLFFDVFAGLLDLVLFVRHANDGRGRSGGARRLSSPESLGAGAGVDVAVVDARGTELFLTELLEAHDGDVGWDDHCERVGGMS